MDPKDKDDDFSDEFKQSKYADMDDFFLQALLLAVVVLSIMTALEPPVQHLG